MRSVSPIGALIVAMALFSSLAAGCNAACDGDGDGFCAPEDCNDSVARINPDAAELCNGIDDNCNGGLSAMEVDDNDGDGSPECFDCNDSDPDTYPEAPERCDGEDNDCDGEVLGDEVDDDGDGYFACQECDDQDSGVYPGAEEVCDGVDSDCDEVLPATETDQDDDGFLECNGDCDPNRGTVFPGAEEVCDGRDNDCDGQMLDDETIDNDGDGHSLCTDCDDDDISISPDVMEICDGIDNNCDGELILNPKTGEPAEIDIDEDGWFGCEGDCNDQDPEISPAEYELVDNAVDDDCDGTADNEPGWTSYSDPEDMMLTQLGNECEWHQDAVSTADFDEVAGAAIGTTIPGIEFTAELDGVPVDVLFADAVAPYAGSGYAVSDGPVDSLTVLFDTLQDFVVYAITVEDPSAAGDYAIELFQYDAFLILGGTFGPQALDGWNLRGASSHSNVGYDEMVFLPASSSEVILLDELSFCR